MKRMFFFLMFLPAGVFGQTKLDSLMRAAPVLSGTTSYVWGASASVLVLDSATAASNCIAMYQKQKVKRDTTQSISISRDSIYQGNKLIGYFHFIRGSDITEIYSPTGFIQASAENTQDKTWHIMYWGNGTKSDFISIGFFEEDIATFLVKQGYL